MNYVNFIIEVELLDNNNIITEKINKELIKRKISKKKYFISVSPASEFINGELKRKFLISIINKKNIPKEILYMLNYKK